MDFDFTSLTFDSVSRSFGRRRALHRVSLRCEAGDVLALLGPNGAGKSTLLAIAAGLLAPTDGDVRYGMTRARDAGAALRARVGVLGHDLFLYPELSARENLTFFARLYGVGDVDACVSAALDRCRLADRADDPVIGFSRGMRQRVAIERALLHAPRLVLLDEPFTGLDDASSAALASRIGALREEGRIVIVTTHDLEAIDPIATAALVLRAGRALSIGSREGGLRAAYRRALADQPGDGAIAATGGAA